MSYDLKLADLGEGIQEGEIVRLLVKEGERVREDQPLLEVATDKVNVEITAPKAGVVGRILVKEGERVKVGSTLLIIEEVELPPIQERAISDKGEAGIRATPAVRRLAKELGIDLAQVKGTGPEGRITERDVLESAKGITKEERLQLKGARKVIAERVERSHNIPQVTHFEEVEVTQLKAVREALREGGMVDDEEMVGRLTYLPFVMRAACRALKEFPLFNAHFDEEKEEVVKKGSVHLGFTIDAEQGVLLGVIRDADKKGVLELAKECRSIARRAREGRLGADEVGGATFTITNIGSVGGIMATPMIYPPQVAILGIYRSLERPLVREGRVEVGEVMNLSITFDHRVIDGADAARFLRRLKELLEKPAQLLL